MQQSGKKNSLKISVSLVFNPVHFLLTLIMGLMLLGGVTGCLTVVEVRPAQTPTPTVTPTPPPTPRLDVTPQDDRPRFRVVNASLRMPVADIYLNDRLYFKGVYYSYVSNYVPVDRKSFKVRVRPAGLVDANPLTERDWEFKDDRQYTMLLLSTPGGIDQPWIFEDNNKGSLSPGKARLRMVHAALDMPAIDICLSDRCDVLAFKQVSEYITVDEGPYNLTMRIAGEDSPQFAVLPVSVQAGQVYSVFVLDPEQGEIRPRVIPHLDTE
jgi:hypothetical protein